MNTIELKDIGISKIEVNAKDFYSQSGVKVYKGNAYSFEVDPSTSHWKDSWIKTDADGFHNPLFLLPFINLRNKKAKCLELCACFDQNDTTSFSIGKKLVKWFCPTDGVLYFYGNDYKSKVAYGNNKGILQLNLISE